MLETTTLLTIKCKGQEFTHPSKVTKAEDIVGVSAELEPGTQK